MVILLQLHRNSGEKEDFKVIDSASQKEQILGHISRRDLGCAAKIPIDCPRRHSRRKGGLLVSNQTQISYFLEENSSFRRKQTIQRLLTLLVYAKSYQVFVDRNKRKHNGFRT